MAIVEFKDRYPDYKLGFLAENSKTKTEELVGYRMSLLFAFNKQWQAFSIPDAYYAQLQERLQTLIPNQYVVMSLNDAEFYLQKKDESIIGFCYQTKERVAIVEEIHVKLPDFCYDDEGHLLDRETILDAMHGDWKG